MMPDVSGLTLLRFVRSHQHLHNVPVIMMSASEAQETMCAALMGAADEYLVKPVTRKEVANIWMHVMKRYTAAAAPPPPQPLAAPGAAGALEAPPNPAAAGPLVLPAPAPGRPAAAAAAGGNGRSSLNGGAAGGPAPLLSLAPGLGLSLGPGGAAAGAASGPGLGLPAQLARDVMHAFAVSNGNPRALPESAPGAAAAAARAEPLAGAAAVQHPTQPGEAGITHPYDPRVTRHAAVGGGGQAAAAPAAAAGGAAPAPGTGAAAAAPATPRVTLLKWLRRPNRAVQPKESFWIFCEVLLLLESCMATQGSVYFGVRPSRLVLHSTGRIAFLQQQPGLAAAAAMAGAGGPGVGGGGGDGRGSDGRKRRRSQLGEGGSGVANGGGGSSEPSFGQLQANGGMSAAAAGGPVPRPPSALPRQQTLGAAAGRVTAEGGAAAAAAAAAVAAAVAGGWDAEEEALYRSPEEEAGMAPTPASDMFSLGLLFFELFYCAGGSDRAALLRAARQRLLPRAFGSQQPREAAFCLALLHPAPASRPTLEELLGSGMFRATCASLRLRGPRGGAAQRAAAPGGGAAAGRGGGGIQAAGTAAAGQAQALASHQQRAAPGHHLQPQHGLTAGAVHMGSAAAAASRGGHQGQGQGHQPARASPRSKQRQRPQPVGAGGGPAPPQQPAAAAAPAPPRVEDSVLLEFLHTLRSRKLQELAQVESELQAVQSDAQAVEQYLQYMDAARAAKRHRGAPPPSAPLAPLEAQQQQGAGGAAAAAAAMAAVPALPARSAAWREAQQAAQSKWSRVEGKYEQIAAVFAQRRRPGPGSASPTPQAAAAAAEPPSGGAAGAAGSGRLSARHADAGGLPEPLLRFAEDLSAYATSTSLTPLATLRYGDPPSSCMVAGTAFDRDDEFFALAGVSKRIKIYEKEAVLRSQVVGAHYPVLEMTSRSRLSSVTWSGYIKGHLACADYEGVVTLWDANTATELLTLEEHRKRVWSIDFSQADPARLLSGGDDGLVKLWSIQQESSLATLDLRVNVCSVQFSPTSPHVFAACCANSRCLVYDLRSPARPLHVVPGPGRAFSYVRWLGPGCVVTASVDSTLRLWQLDCVAPDGAPRCVQTFRGHSNERNFTGMDVSPEGYLAVGSETNRVYCYHQSMPMPAAVYDFTTSCNGGGGGVDGGGLSGGGAVGGVDGVMDAGGAAAGAAGNTGGDGGGGAAAQGHFMSSMCWSRRSNLLLAGNSAGVVKLFALQ